MRSFLFVFLFVGFVSLAGIFSCCKKDNCTTCPPPVTNCEYPAGNRNFAWRLDTVAWFPSTLGGVWAFSDTDAYVMGYIGEGKPPYRIFVGKHWNGKVWDNNINGTDAEVGHVANDVTGDDHFMVSVGNWAINPSKPAIGEFDNLTKKWKNYQFETQGELRSVWTDGKGYFIATGDSGMVYTKDSYSAGWIYQKAPTDFNFTNVTGVSKAEVYARGVKSLATGQYYQQLWRYSGVTWTKLMDNQDTTGMPIQIPEAGDEVYEIAASRCSITDSLYLYVVGRESFKFISKGDDSAFVKEDLAPLGLPSSQQAAGFINLFSPNDYWVSGLRYQLYHWNGSDFQKIQPIPTLPYGQLWGVVSRIRKNGSGKIWMILEMDSQVYSIIQGKP
jgi:hypothetical protein